jgi:hypothetical protein
MSVDIEYELRATMQELTADLQAPPDLLSRLSRRTPLLRPRYAVALVAVAAAALIVAVSLVVPRVGDSTGPTIKPLSTYKTDKDFSQREQQASRDMQVAVANWGPTRGDRATDEQVLAQVRNEWNHPSSHPTELGSFEPVISPDGPVQVLWAGTAPGGVAAIAVQHTKDPAAQYWYGFFLPGPDGQPRLAQRNQLTGGLDLAELDPYAFSFTTSIAHSAVVVVPTKVSDSVRIAFSAEPGADGMLAPQWQSARIDAGAAVIAVPPTGDAWGTIVETTHDGAASVHNLDFIATHLINEGPPQPANVLGLWCNGCTVAGEGSPGYSGAMLRAWTERHGPAYLPTYTAEWSVGAQLPDGSAVFATQLWIVGDKAHTVVVANSPAKGTVEVLYDEVTDTADRPLLATRLPQAAGWLVGAGPDAVLTGWRTLGGNWHSVASKKAILVPTDDTSIQLRLVVKGQERIVTR